MNLFRAFFDQTDVSGHRVRFVVPPLTLASGRPALTLSFGDATANWTTDATGEVFHSYVDAGFYTATLTDADNVQSTMRFEVPRGDTQPLNVQACPIFG